MLVKLQPFKEESDANSAPVDVAAQYLRGEITEEPESNTVVTLPLGK
jgi:hypothetical protein